MDSNDKLLKELENDKNSPQFLMVHDKYCSKELSPALACFLSFLVFKAEKYSRIHPGIKQFIGYSNESLQKLYANKYFKVSTRTITQYLLELKKRGLITIVDENTVHRKIYINYEAIEPEKYSNLDENIIIKEKEEQIKRLEEQLQELKKQNDELMESLAKQTTTPAAKEEMGYFVKILFDKKYLKESDKLTSTQLDDYNTTLKSFLWQFKNQPDKDLFQAINYVCACAKNKKIRNKFVYLMTSLQNYLDRNIPDSLWEDDEFTD